MKKTAPKTSASAEELELLVTKMREMGVTEWNGIKLGPAPVPAPEPPTPEQIVKRREEQAERQMDIMFAASRVRPLRLVKK